VMEGTGRNLYPVLKSFEFTILNNSYAIFNMRFWPASVTDLEFGLMKVILHTATPLAIMGCG